MRNAEGSKQIVEGYRSGVIIPGAPPERFLAGRMSESLAKGGHVGWIAPNGEL
jgi:hypothetical protein